MPFIWNNNPNPPTRELPTPVPPGELSYQVHEIANTVNAGGTVSYNTPNVGFDILYELPSANINIAHFAHAFFDNLTVNTANISTATITLATIDTANITNANIQYGYVGSDPTSNLGIASKHYVDTAMANVPTGGSDLQNIIDARGDLLVGTGFHTATRLPVGTTGQILTADSTSNTGLRWRTFSGVTSFRGLWIQTHHDVHSSNNKVVLRSCDEIVMSDGSGVSGWSNLEADISVSGVGGLDTGSEATSSWYEVYALGNSSNSQLALMLHRAPRTNLNQSYITTTDNGVTLRRATSTATNVAMSFIPSTTGPLRSVELELSKTGSPTGTIWITINTDNAGVPSDTILATSRIYDVGRLPTDKGRIRFLFDANTTVTSGTTYHIVYQSDYTLSDTNYTTMWGTSADGYASGRATQKIFFGWTPSVDVAGGPNDFWFKTFIQDIPATPIVLPTNWDQYALVSYVYNDGAGNFKPYIQRDHTVVTSISTPWRAFEAVTGLLESVDLSATIPPITSCVARFSLWIMSGSPAIPSALGINSATDLSPTLQYSRGSITANVRFSFTPAGTAIGEAGRLIVEHQMILARMQNVSSRIYVTEFIF